MCLVEREIPCSSSWEREGNGVAETSLRKAVGGSLGGEGLRLAGGKARREEEECAVTMDAKVRALLKERCPPERGEEEWA